MGVWLAGPAPYHPPKHPLGVSCSPGCSSASPGSCLLPSPWCSALRTHHHAEILNQERISGGKQRKQTNKKKVAFPCPCPLGQEHRPGGNEEGRGRGTGSTKQPRGPARGSAPGAGGSGKEVRPGGSRRSGLGGETGPGMPSAAGRRCEAAGAADLPVRPALPPALPRLRHPGTGLTSGGDGEISQENPGAAAGARTAPAGPGTPLPPSATPGKLPGDGPTRVCVRVSRPSLPTRVTGCLSLTGGPVRPVPPPYACGRCSVPVTPHACPAGLARHSPPPLPGSCGDAGGREVRSVSGLENKAETEWGGGDGGSAPHRGLDSPPTLQLGGGSEPAVAGERRLRAPLSAQPLTSLYRV